MFALSKLSSLLKLPAILIACLSFCMLDAQNRNIDSLKLLVSGVSSRSSNIANDTTFAKAYNALSREYIFIGAYDIADSIAAEALKFSEKKLTQYADRKLFFSQQQAIGYTCLGIVQSCKGNQTAALDYFNTSLNLSTALGDKKGISSSLGSIGNVFKEQGNYSRALESYFGALKYAEEMNLDKIAAINLANIGNAYQALSENQKALDYYFKALKLAEKINDKRGIAIDFGNIGRVYMHMNNYDKALEYYFKSLTMAESMDLKLHITHTLGNIGSLYIKKKDLAKALEYMKKGLVKAEEIGEKGSIVRLTGGIGGIYIDQNKPEAAEPILKKALALAIEINDLSSIQLQHQSLSRLYATQSKWKEAFIEHRLYIIARDSLFNQESTRKALRSELNFEYEKKATADSVKHESEQKIKDAEIALQQEQLKQARTRSYALYGGLALVLVFAGIMYNRFKVTQKQKHIIEAKEKETEMQNVIIRQQKMLVEQKHKEITDSIRYAQRIQSSLLSPEKYIDKNIKRLKG